MLIETILSACSVPYAERKFSIKVLATSVNMGLNVGPLGQNVDPSCDNSFKEGRAPINSYTGISSHFGAKLCDWAERQAEAGCYSWAVMSSNDSKTR